MPKLDWKKDYKTLYFPPPDPVMVDVPPMNYLMIDGHGDPNTSPAYQAAVEALFSLAYTLKFGIKKAAGIDYAVYPAEGLWWVADMAEFANSPKSDWDWTMLIAQPEAVSAEWVERARAEALKKKGLPALEQVRFETYAEGRCAQLMHTGPYAAEAPNIARLHAFIAAQGYRRRGKHHEIYLSDYRRAAPEKLKTVVRQPVGPA
ncbi:MAG TPA: GyrI-like domain-containing protein [Anaerolineales bacterium]